jgi:prepilin-type N-terminal cleavage/methylation domain-containing protein
MNRFRRRHAFTLIELLIVVAIIAILAAIAVPNFLEAQTRAKVARTLADMRTLATALESYAVDYNKYPPHGQLTPGQPIEYPAVTSTLDGLVYLSSAITTPVAYMTSMLEDPFARLPLPLNGITRGYGYLNNQQQAKILVGMSIIPNESVLINRYGEWRTFASGPDGDKGMDTLFNVLYDATNGTISDGDIVRSQKSPRENNPSNQ